MKREEHYCDRCGAQMTAQDADGNTNCFGVTVLAQKASESHTITANIVANYCTETSSGSWSGRQHLTGIEFCSFGCFKEAMTNFIEKVEVSIGFKS
jgi:hypothetical protein